MFLKKKYADGEKPYIPVSVNSIYRARTIWLVTLFLFGFFGNFALAAVAPEVWTYFYGWIEPLVTSD